MLLKYSILDITKDGTKQPGEFIHSVKVHESIICISMQMTVIICNEKLYYDKVFKKIIKKKKKTKN